MRVGTHELSIEKRVALSGLQATLLAVLAIVVALALFGIIFLLAGVNPFKAYAEIFSIAFFNTNGLPLTMNRFIFLLLCSCAFIIPFRAGLWNIGMTGQLYTGALVSYAVLLLLGAKGSGPLLLPPLLVILLAFIAAAVGGAFLGGIAGYLKGRFDVNEIVTTMMLNFIVFYLVSFMIKDGGILQNPGGRGESFELPVSIRMPLVADIPVTIILALGVAVLLFFLFAKMRIGYEIKAQGESPPAARYAGISTAWTSFLVFVLGGALSGWAGYHYFAAVPGVYKIARNYGQIGDLAFYGIICGLISRGNPLAAIPIAFLFAGLSIGGRFVQGKLGMAFGVDYALLGVLMITLVAFQFFYRYQFSWTKVSEEQVHVGISD